jgi:hypothetical protein
VLAPTNVNWQAGAAATSGLIDRFYTSMPQPKGFFTITSDINGQRQLLSQGTSPASIRLSLETGPDTTAGLIAARAFQAERQRTVAQQAALRLYPQLQEKAIAGVEQQLLHAVNNSVSLPDALKLMHNLDQYVDNATQIAQQIHTDFIAGKCHQDLWLGAQGVCDDLAKTVGYIKGALCDSGGHIVGVSSVEQQKVLAKVYGDHCRRIGYTPAAMAAASAVLGPAFQSLFNQSSFHVNAIKNSAFNQDLIKMVNCLENGFAEHAQVVMKAYDPSKFGSVSNWWYDRGKLYRIASRTYDRLYASLYTQDGIFKPFTQHPLWQEMEAALRANPALKNQIIKKLQHEYAFSMQMFEKIGIMQPSAEQMGKMYQLCQYSYLNGFDAGINSLYDMLSVDKLLRVFAQDHGLFQGMRQVAGCTETVWNKLLGNQTLLKNAHLDPHLNALLQSIQTTRDADTVLEILQSRLAATNTLLERCAVSDPNDLTRTLSYHMLDNYHDPVAMMQHLSGLDPHHADQMVQQSYYDFFDANGVQKLIPVHDQVRALFQDLLGNSIFLHDNAVLRNAFNQLTLFDVTDDQLTILGRGFNYIEQGFSNASHAPFMQNFADGFVQALTQPNDANRSFLGMTDIVDGFLMPMPEDTKKIYTDILSRVFDPENIAKISSADIKKMLDSLQNASRDVRIGNFASAENSLRPWSKVPDISSVPDGFFGSTQRGSPSRPHSLPQPVDQPSIPISNPLPVPNGPTDIQPSDVPPLFAKDGSAQSGQNTYGKILKDAVTTTLITQLIQNGLPGFGSSSGTQRSRLLTEMQEQVRQSEIIKQRIKREQLIRKLLSEGKIIAETNEGTLVLFEDKALHVGADGSVESVPLGDKDPYQFARDVRNTYDEGASIKKSDLFSEAATASEQQSHRYQYPESAKEPEVGDIEDVADLLAKLKKRHRDGLGSSSKKGVSEPSACCGDPDPPEDPRNNKWKKQERNGIGRKLKSEETILKKFGKVRGRRVKGAQLYTHKGRYYHLDTFHTGESAHLEVYNGKGIHLGEADPNTGQIMPGTADLTKSINIK